jgi:hypothetical protein
MKIVSIAMAFAFTVMSILAAMSPADARLRDHPNYGICKSMKKVADVRNCKEFGGTR